MCKSNSWVIVNKATGKPVLETFNPNIVNAKLKPAYKLLTAYEYLCQHNASIKAVKQP